MPSSYTARNRAEKQADGENSNTWGSRFNTNTADMFDAAIDGMASYALSGVKTLTSNNGSADEARMHFQNITSGTGGTVTIPNVEKVYLVRNATSGNVIFTTGSGTTATVPTGQIVPVVSAGGNVVYAVLPVFAGSTNTFSAVQTFSALPVLSGGGISFPATAVPAADANTLDDYEEGTFTPSVNFGFAATGITYTTQTGRYTKVGRRVFFGLYIVLSSKGSATGDAAVRGLPFVQTNTSAASGCPQMHTTNTITVPGYSVALNDEYINLTHFAAGSTANMTDAHFNNTTSVRISGSYDI